MSHKKSDAEQKPLMYIVQPDYDTADANMQDIVIKRKKKSKPKPNASEKKENQKEEHSEAQQSKEKDGAEAVHNEVGDRPEKGIKPIKKPLSKMSITEKIDFLTSLPGNMPKTLCLIEAGGKTYRGTIVEKKGDSVFVRTSSKGSPAELKVENITSLHPLGF
ncbi:CotO family spore coat protein [Bacillus swezeyi]|uniref:Spore coat protein CotO n=1 Tax=Bacillus swezeyi TaxID=1925020 RepID=A0A5M8S1I9_9BACI|nr:CotO family spore coat protein [Bacillus swezeyi]KAA6453276.1 spore coat protein CotO [Bacillus swezeyi]KAA6476106.1 spore coat protein CotO [Bacillus swezeyi]TYS38649.1 spore coat protein CotO [Bacillus swezeyi]